MRNSRIILKYCPGVLGLEPLPKNGHTDYQYKEKCVAAIIDFFHVYPASLVLRNIWKVARISDEDCNEMFQLFEQLPSGFTVNDFDLLFNKYSCAPKQVLHILRSIELESLQLNTIQESLKKVKKEFLPLLKDYGAYYQDWDEDGHVEYIAGDNIYEFSQMETKKEILAEYLSTKTRNLHRYISHRDKLEFLKRNFKNWYVFLHFIVTSF